MLFLVYEGFVWEVFHGIIMPLLDSPGLFTLGKQMLLSMYYICQVELTSSFLWLVI